MNGNPVIRRDVRSVDGARFDVVIVGGGIYGALCAVESSHRGLSTLLIEAADFGGAASFNSLRTVHGGLRYLQRLDFVRARQSNVQQGWWFEHFPDLVQARPCLMPLYGRLARGRAAFRAAGVLARLSGMRPAPGPAQTTSSLIQLLTASEVRDRLPGIPSGGLRGGALWTEGFMPETSRVLMECLRWAVAAGAIALNYVELVGAQGDGRGRTRLLLADRCSEDALSVAAAAVVNAGGYRANEVARRLGASSVRVLLPTLAWNLLLDARLPDRACLALTPPRRKAQTYFLHQLHGGVLAGTGHAGTAVEESARPRPEMVDEMRQDLDAAYPEARLGTARVRRVLAGVLPGVRESQRRLATRPEIVRDAAAGGARVAHVVGVKYTEAPHVARRAIDLIAGPSRTGPGPRPAPAENWHVLDGLRPPTRETLLGLAAHESVVCLQDLVERRTNAWCDDSAIALVSRLTEGTLARHAARSASNQESEIGRGGGE